MTEKALFPQQITFKLGDDTIVKWYKKLPTKALAMSWLKAYRLAEKYHPEYSMSSKTRASAYDPRGRQGIGLNYIPQPGRLSCAWLHDLAGGSAFHYN